MKTIEQVLEEFLEGPQARLKPGTYSGYEEMIELLLLKRLCSPISGRRRQ
jgi:hypothetical protein